MGAKISESGFVTIGAMPQWVEVHGADRANPVLIALHGGPGMAETPLLRHFNCDLERIFTVVYWEQRGAGRTYSKSTPPESMTVERFIADLDELVDHVRVKLGKDKVVLLGHSWGSALGTLYAAKHPEKVSAYVGTGQIGDLAASEAAGYAFVLEEAKRRGKTKAVTALTELGPPPWTEKQMMVQRQWLSRFVGTFGSLPLGMVLRVLLFAPGTSVFNIPKVYSGMMFSLRTLWGQVSAINLERDAPELKVPVWFLNGRNDHQVSAVVAQRYFDKLVAPKKTLIWFEQSGHFAPFEEPEKFNQAMAAIKAAIA